MKKLLFAVSCALVTVFAAQAKVRYVDCEHGNDANSGESLAEAFKTIRAATTNAVSSDIIYVAPGVYGEAEGVQVVAGQNIGNRVLLPAGVTLESLEGAEKTFIVGAADPDAYTENYGTGPKAIRCIHAVGADTHIRGFTITGGHTYSNTTDGASSDANGAAVYSTASKSVYACVEDCIVSNNFCYGATLNACRVIRSRVTKNRSIRGDEGTTGAAGTTCYWYGCIVDDNYGKAAMATPMWIESCTIKQASGVRQVIFSNNSCMPINTVLLSGTTYKVISATNCMFQTGASTISSYAEDCYHSIFTNAANMKVDADFRPEFGSYAGIDAGDVKYASEYLGDKDIYGNPRVMNGKMDIGAVEYDWRPNYAALLGEGVTVETASAAVHSTDDAVVVPSGSALAGTLTRVGEYGVYKIAFQVSGEGTATLKLGGEVFGEYVAGDYVVEVESFDAASGFGFTFEGDGELVIRSVTFADYWYVNGTLGDDNNDGRTPKTPKATIRAATTNAVAGDVIYVAPGDYGAAEGSREIADLQTRVIVPEGVRLQGEGAPYAAVIHGAAASEGDEYGNGDDAVRCVYLYKNATLANFTLTEGHTTAATTGGNGSAVYSRNTTATVTDCLVTNNFSYNGTLYSGRNIRCRIVGNTASYRSVLGYAGIYYGCFFDNSKAQTRHLNGPISIDFCTLGKNIKTFEGGSPQIISASSIVAMRNSVMMYGRLHSQGNIYATNCVLHSDIDLAVFGGCSNCVSTSAADMKLSDDGVPTADSPVNNAGNVEFAPDCINETDLDGVPRVLNGGVDAGAFEHDWRVEYKEDLGPRATAVTAASPMVVETNGVVRISSGSLEGTFKLGGAVRLDVTLKDGTLEVYQGKEHKTFTATEETQASVELWPEEGNDAFRLVFTPSPSAADGYAEIARLKKGTNGIIFMVR